MILETIFTEGLAHFSYLIGDRSAGVCAVIDPRRDFDIYLQKAKQHHLRITHVIETHIHADFVSGGKELAAYCGAEFCGGEQGNYEFPHRALQDGEIIRLGEVRLTVYHTPGHTPDPICLLVSGGSSAEAPWGLFTGDTLFAGEIGRPDLLGKENEEKLARQLFQSLHEKIFQLPDYIVIYPAHGKGSPCGAAIGDRSTSTLGYEKANNPLLQITDAEHFSKEVLKSLEPAPAYYPKMKQVNARGPKPLGRLPYLQPLSAEEFRKEMQQENTVVVDTREIEAFAAAHIKNSLSIPFRESFPIWAGRILEPEQRFLLVLQDDALAEQARLNLLRVGLDDTIGYLRKGIRSWIEAGNKFESIHVLDVHRLNRWMKEGRQFQLLDVREKEEFKSGHLPGARHIFVPDLPGELENLDKSLPVVLYCGSGFRSSIAASLLLSRGFQVINVPGSYTAWQAAGKEIRQPESKT
ncbi:MAG: rhodanese-like domain-containing protein [Calditrichia bacterium]